MKRLTLVCALVTLSASMGLMLLAQPRNPSSPPACDPDNGGLTLPAGFCVLVVADNLGIGRQMAVAANGDLFVSLRNVDAKTPGAIVALRDADRDGKFEVQEKFGNQGGTGIAL